MTNSGRASAVRAPLAAEAGVETAESGSAAAPSSAAAATETLYLNIVILRTVLW